MGYQPMEELLPKAGYSTYRLIRMAAIRAVELAEGKPRLVDVPLSEKTATVALEEIREGRVVLETVAEQFARPEPKKKNKKNEEPLLEEMIEV